MRLCRVAIAVTLLVMITVPSWFITTLGNQMPLITVVDETLEQSPIGGTALAQNEWETSAFGNISLMVKGNFTGDEASDFIVVNGTDPEMIPVYFDEWETPTGNNIHCVNGSDGEILWSVEVNNTVTDLDVADINGDGYDEIFVSILRWNVSDPDDHNKLDNGGQLFALDRNGVIMWNHSSGQHGAYMSVIGDFNGDNHDDVAAVWTWDQMQYNVTVYTAFNGTAWDSHLFTQYEHKTYYDNGTLYTGNFGYQTVPIQGVAADWDDDGTDTLVLQANHDVYNETAGHEFLESSTVLLFHYEGNPVSIELNSTFGTATQEHGYDFNAPPMVAGDFITETGDSDWIGVVVPLNETHRVANILSNSGSVLASRELVRAHTAWLVAADINNDGIDDLVMSDLLFDSYDGFPSPAVIAVLDGTDLEVIFEELPGTNGMQGIAALHIDVGDIDPTSDGLEILTSGMSSLVVFNATGDIVYYEAFTGIGLFSFFSDVDKDGHLEIVRGYSTWSFMQSGYTSKVSSITEFVMMIPGSLTADEWFVYSNENATVSAQFIAPFENTNGVNVSLWNATVTPGQGFVDITLNSPIIDTQLLDLTVGVPYTFEYEWNTSQLAWSQMAFTLRNETSADKAIAVFAMGGDKPTVSYTDYQDLVNKGLRWLLAEQESGGYWLAYTDYEGDEWDAPSVASTAMAAIALLNNGTISSNVTKAIDWILAQRNLTSGAIFHWAQNQTDVVETTWAILALHAYNGTLSAFNNTISETITNATEWLVSAQYQVGYEYEEGGQPETVDENSIQYGAWSPRANNTEEPVDIYVTSLALAALNLVNYSSPQPTEMARVFISRAQNHLYTNPIGLRATDGGFLGIPERQVGSIGSGTGAGLFAMALSGAAQENPEGYGAAANWIHDNFILDEHVGVENYMGGLFFTRMLLITDYWFFLNLGMTLSSGLFDATQFAALDQVVADAAAPDADDTARWEAFFGEDSWRATAKCIMTLQTRHGPNPGKLRVEMHSNAYLTLIAPDGSTIGYNHTSGLDMTPLGATYSGPGSDPQVIEVPEPQKGYWTIVADGNSTGHFDIVVSTYSSSGNLLQTQLLESYDVNETDGWEFEISVFRAVDILTVEVDLTYSEFDYAIDMAIQLVEDPGPPRTGRLEVTASSTDSSIGDIEGPEALEHMWYLYNVADNTTPQASEELTWNGGNSLWEANFNLDELVNGEYYFSVAFRTIHTELTYKNQSTTFLVAHQLSFSLPTLTYGQSTQTIVSDSFEVTSTYAGHGTIDDVEATQYQWYLYDAASGGNLLSSGTLTYSAGEFFVANTTVADVPEGSYYLRVYFETSQAIQWVNGTSVALVVDHSLTLSTPVWDYDSDSDTLDISGLTATSSYSVVGLVESLEANNHSCYIFTSEGVFTGLSFDLSYAVGPASWEATMDVSSLAPGDYYAYAVIGVGSDLAITEHFGFIVEEEATTSTTPTTTTETQTTTTPTTTLPPPDYTMLIVVSAGAAAIVVVIIVLGVMRKRK